MSALKRRDWIAGIAIGSLGLGVGAWLRHRQPPVVVGDTAAAAASAASVALPTLTPLPDPIHMTDGRTLTNADVAGRFVVLNFWAPWCPPCVREMPDIDRFAHSDAGKNTLVIGLAIDEQANVDKFLAAHPVSYPISVLGYAGLAWARRLSNDPNVALPFTAVFDRSQQLAQHKFGSTNADELAGWTRGS